MTTLRPVTGVGPTRPSEPAGQTREAKYHHPWPRRATTYSRRVSITAGLATRGTLSAISTQLSPAWLLRLLLRHRALIGASTVRARPRSPSHGFRLSGRRRLLYDS